MNYTTWTPEMRLIREGEEVAAQSLYQSFHRLNDARRGQGKRYQLALVLTLLVLAKLAGQKTLSGATQWIRHRAPPVGGTLCFEPKGNALSDDLLPRLSRH